MANPVVVVESADKLKTLQDQFKGDLDGIVILSAPVQVTYSPPRDAMRREPPKFKFMPSPREKVFWDSLLSFQGREIYLALDGDWRGEFWSWIISEYWAEVSGGVNMPMRLSLAGLAGAVLDESFKVVEPVSSAKATASYIGMLFDSYLAKHLQRLLGTRTGPQGLPLNFASLTTLFIVAEREREIRMYTPHARWYIMVKLATGNGEFMVRLEEAYGVTDDAVLHNEKELRQAIDLFRTESFVVSEVESSSFSIPRPEPYRFEELLHDCHVLYGLQPRQVLTAVRKLFSGVEIDGKSHGLITSYLPLANSSFVELLREIREYLAGIAGEGALGVAPEFEEMRGMILPTIPKFGKDQLAAYLAEDELQVYGLIWSRALAGQMQDATGEIIDITVAAGEECIFKGSARRLKGKGFFDVYQGTANRDFLGPCPVAAVVNGQQLQCIQVIPEKSTGMPPEYYTFEGLSQDLAEFAIDFDGFFVAMIQQMLDKGYLLMMPDGSFRCADNAKKLIGVMNRAFPSMKDVNFVAYLAQTISEAVSGRKSLAFALQQFEQTMMMRGELLVKMAMPVAPLKRVKSSRSIIKTPAAPVPLAESPAPSQSAATKPAEVVDRPVAPHEGGGQAVEVRAEVDVEVEEVSVKAEPVGSENPAQPAEVGAESAPALEPEPELEPESAPAEEEVTVTEPVEEAVAVSGEEAAATEEMFAQAPVVEEEESLVEAGAAPEETKRAEEREPGRECPDCGRPLLLKEDRFGRYWSCSGYPECRYSASYGKQGGEEMLCPLCNIGNVIAKNTPTGKPFYVCPEPDCEFMAWAKPHAVACQVCDSPFLVEKKNISGKSYLRCQRAGCGYMRPLPGDNGIDLVESGEPRKKKKIMVRRVAKKSAASGGIVKKKVRIVRRKK